MNAVELITHLNRGGAVSNFWFLKNKSTRWCEVGAPLVLPTEPDSYFSVHPCASIPPTNSKGETTPAVIRTQGKFVAGINCAFAEFDAKDFNDSKDEALAYIRALMFAPSIIVDSGGGYHCYWLLDQPFIFKSETDRACADALQKRFVDTVQGDVGAKDLARVLRVPGTLNAKYTPARPVQIIDDAGTLYTLDQLREWVQSAQPVYQAEAAVIERVPASTSNVSGGSGSSVIAEFNATHTVAGELTKHGYTISGDGKSFTRPGKDSRLGNSGTISMNGKESVYTFSSNDPLFNATARAGHRADAFDVSVHLDHGGDFKAAAKSAAEEQGKSYSKNGKHAPGDADTKDDKPVKMGHERDTCDDMGNGYRFADQHGHVVRHVDTWGWMIYDGKRWTRDTTNVVMHLAKSTVASIWDEVNQAGKVDTEEGQKKAKRLAAWASLSRSRGRLESMLVLAKSELPAKAEVFDREPLILNVQNGTLDLRTFELRPHDPADMLTRICDAAYDPNGDAPMWKATLKRFMSDELIAFMQRSFGLAITGQTEKAFWFLYGPSGDNGKSTITATVAQTLGDYADHVSVDVLTGKHRSPGDEDQLASLSGARMVVSSEVDARQMNARLIKDLTGEMDTIRTKFMGQGTFEFRPRFKLFIYGNKQPRLDATDQALWNRVQRVSFDRVIAKSEQIKNFSAQLKAESDGILTWLVKGFEAYQRDGLNPPAEVTAGTQAYRDEMDTLGHFIRECCVLNPVAFVAFAEFKEAYERFAGAKAIDAELSKALVERGFTKGRTPHGGVRIYRGLGLLAVATAEGQE